ncbi:hypothetical protein OHT20_00510 [Streptomyces caniferus]|uniref:Uncharacterized protein n=1 Tax=Streptomyces caniferus TaxID=285557 RepID=A0ABZ1VCF2_9ACTN|nr:hypothetical protein [Streptomyces caniferus]
MAYAVGHGGKMETSTMPRGLYGMHTPADYLELARAENDGAVLHRLVRCPYPFVWHALAANVHTPTVALLELSAARDSAWNDNMLLRLLAEHPGADRIVLLAVLDAVATKLTEGERPYAAVLALAERRELEVEEVRRLGALRGSSARLRSRLDQSLGSRA